MALGEVRLGALQRVSRFRETRYGFLLTGVNHEYLVQPCASEEIGYVLSGTDQSDLTFLAARSREEAHERS